MCPYCGQVAGTPNHPAYLLQPGTRLWGRYIIGDVLGVGGFGVTYRAFDSRLATLVAIKEFFPGELVSRIPGESKVRAFSGDKLEAYAAQLARFMDEAKNMAKFNGDAHIVNVFDSFEDNGTAYIVMEFLDGDTLKGHMAAGGGALPPAEAAVILEGLLSALQSIHQKGIIHRDVSPDNIFVLQDGRVKLLDFGAARFAAKEEWTQSVVVKKGYAPPEQYRSNMKQTERTDLYAAGATWYKMLTGVTPEESIERWEKDNVVRPSALGAAVDPNTDKAVMKAMALRPELRFKSAEAMLAALRGQTGFDYPEEELKKRRRLRGVSVAFAAVSVVTALAIAGWQISSMPETIAAGPTLADMDIQPDTIRLQVQSYENETGVFDELAAAFMEKYPGYTVEVITAPWEELDANPPDYAAEGAPTVFHPFWGNGRENLADLSPLINGLDRSEYYLLHRYEEEFQTPDRISLGFEVLTAFGSDEKAAAKGVTLPASFTSFKQIMDAYEPFPEGINLYFYQATDLLGWYEPDIYRDGVFKPAAWEKDLRRYVEYTKADQEERGGYSEDYLIVEQARTWSLRRAAERWPGGFRAIPIEKKGRMSGYSSNAFGVNRNASENQQKVGMLFLHFLLSEYGQNLLHVQNENGLPLNKKAMAQYLELYPALAPLEGKFNDLDFEGSYLPNGLRQQMEEMLGYEAGTINPDEVMRVFMEYQPEQGTD